jgi:hypothetical protein
MNQQMVSGRNSSPMNLAAIPHEQAGSHQPPLLIFLLRRIR